MKEQIFNQPVPLRVEGWPVLENPVGVSLREKLLVVLVFALGGISIGSFDLREVLWVANVLGSCGSSFARLIRNYNNWNLWRCINFLWVRTKCFQGCWVYGIEAVGGVSGGFINTHAKCLSFCPFEEGIPWDWVWVPSLQDCFEKCDGKASLSFGEGDQYNSSELWNTLQNEDFATFCDDSKPI